MLYNFLPLRRIGWLYFWNVFSLCTFSEFSKISYEVHFTGLKIFEGVHLVLPILISLQKVVSYKVYSSFEAFKGDLGSDYLPYRLII